MSHPRSGRIAAGDKFTKNRRAVFTFGFDAPAIVKIEKVQHGLGAANGYMTVKRAQLTAGFRGRGPVVEHFDNGARQSGAVYAAFTMNQKRLLRMIKHLDKPAQFGGCRQPTG